METIDRSKEVRAIVDQITKQATDKGKLIEAGWLAFEYQCLRTASEMQREEMRKAWFLGAQHLFASIMGIMDEDREPTEQDMRRMSQVNDELAAFIKQYKEDHTQ